MKKTPGAEGLNFEIGDESITDTEEWKAEAGVSIFPNPAVSTLQVTVSDVSGLGAVQVWNAQGQLMLSRMNIELGATVTSLDVSTLPSGMYYLQVAVEGQLLTRKWMKQ